MKNTATLYTDDGQTIQIAMRKGLPVGCPREFRRFLGTVKGLLGKQDSNDDPEFLAAHAFYHWNDGWTASRSAEHHRDSLRIARSKASSASSWLDLID